MKKYLELITAKKSILAISLLVALTLIFTIAIHSQADSQDTKLAPNNTSNRILAAKVVHAAEAEISEDTIEKPTTEDETLADNYARSYNYYKELYGPKEQPKKVVVDGIEIDYIAGAPYSVYEAIAKANIEETETVVVNDEVYLAEPTEQVVESIEAETVENNTEETPEETPEATEAPAETYSGDYNPADFAWMGVINWNGSKWTYYSEKVLPGGGLNIPGRHVDEYGFVCDENGYICLAADPSYIARGSVISTPFGREGKIYDCGCAYGTVDCYVSW